MPTDLYSQRSDQNASSQMPRRLLSMCRKKRKEKATLLGMIKEQLVVNLSFPLVSANIKGGEAGGGGGGGRGFLF